MVNLGLSIDFEGSALMRHMSRHCRVVDILPRTLITCNDHQIPGAAWDSLRPSKESFASPTPTSSDSTFAITCQLTHLDNLRSIRFLWPIRSFTRTEKQLSDGFYGGKRMFLFLPATEAVALNWSRNSLIISNCIGRIWANTLHSQVLRYSALGAGIFYGMYHQAKLSSAAKLAVINREYEHKQQLIEKAKAEYSKSKLPPSAKKEDGGSTFAPTSVLYIWRSLGIMNCIDFGCVGEICFIFWHSIEAVLIVLK